MTHTLQGKARLIARVRRIRGQVEGLERTLTAEKGCSEVLHQLAAIRGAVNGLMNQVLEDHLQEHIVSPDVSQEQRQLEAEEFVEVLRTYLR